MDDYVNCGTAWALRQLYGASFGARTRVVPNPHLGRLGRIGQDVPMASTLDMARHCRHDGDAGALDKLIAHVVDHVHLRHDLLHEQREQLSERLEADGFNRVTLPHEQMHVDIPGPDGSVTAADIIMQNVVHTTYWHVRAATEASSRDRDQPQSGPRETAEQRGSRCLPLRRVLRGCMHLGLQLGKPALTKVIVRYMPPWNATHMVFEKGRVYETGARMRLVADSTLATTMQCLREGTGLPTLGRTSRECQNIVATLSMPFPLHLRLMKRRTTSDGGDDDNSTLYMVDYTKAFVGAIVRAPQVTPVKTLAFSSGNVVWVGAHNTAEVVHAFHVIYPLLLASRADTPEHQAFVAMLKENGLWYDDGDDDDDDDDTAVMPPPPSRKRKRDEEEGATAALVPAAKRSRSATRPP